MQYQQPHHLEEDQLTASRIFTKGSKVLNQTLVERYWSQPDGRKMVIAIGKRLFLHESLQFLAASDLLVSSHHSGGDKAHEYQVLYETFIVARSQWEINISAKMRDDFRNLLTTFKTINNADAEDSGEGKSNEIEVALLDLIHKMRREMFLMIDPLVRAQNKGGNNKSGSKSNLDNNKGRIKSKQVLPVTATTASATTVSIISTPAAATAVTNTPGVHVF